MRIRTFSRFWIIGCILIASGCESAAKEFALGGHRYSIDAFEQWKLPKSLREISGLAVTPDGRVFAHGDERGLIHQLDYHGGRLIKSFALTKANGKPLKRDFEGMTALGDDLYLVASDGTLYRFQPGRDGDAVTFQVIPTHGGDVCEVEGLTHHPKEHALLLACKQLYGPKAGPDLHILYFSLDTARLEPGRTIVVSAQQIARKSGTDGVLNPSGIAVSPRAGSLLLVAARQRMALEVTTHGKLVDVFRWPMERYHRQTEGIVQLTDGTLIVGDEGKSKRGRLGVYRATI